MNYCLVTCVRPQYGVSPQNGISNYHITLKRNMIRSVSVYSAFEIWADNSLAEKQIDCVVVLFQSRERIHQTLHMIALYDAGDNPFDTVGKSSPQHDIVTIRSCSDCTRQRKIPD